MLVRWSKACFNIIVFQILHSVFFISYSIQYQDVLISGIVETQRSARHGPETGPKSRLKEVLMLACREPSINKYTSGTALYEYNSLKRSEKMLIGMQNKAVGNVI